MKKNLVFIFVLLSLNLSSFSQNSLGKTDDLGRIALAAFVPDQAEGIPVSTRQLLQNKMLQIAVQNGLGASGFNPRFCIVPMVNVLSKEVTPSAPPMQVVNLEITFYIVDAVSKTIFSQTAISVKGVGQTDDKAYISGIRNINVKAGQFKGFVETGKNKVIEFYNSQCDVILKGAQALAGSKKYEEALFVLLSVPDVCRECFDKCMDLSTDIYKEYANHACGVNMSGARAAWANMDADRAAGFLANITPDMSCYGEATKLVDQITQKMLADGANVWKFKMKRYDDAIDLQKMTILASSDIAIAWANAYYWSEQAKFSWDWNWLYR